MQILLGTFLGIVNLAQPWVGIHEAQKTLTFIRKTLTNYSRNKLAPAAGILGKLYFQISNCVNPIGAFSFPDFPDFGIIVQNPIGAF